MDKYSIGFRIKFDNVESEDVERVVTNFLNIFDRYEIKVTNNIIASGKIYVLLETSERLASGKYSLHLLKDVLSNAKSYAETKRLIRMLQNYRSKDKVHLVTHIPYGNFREYLKYILSISRDLPENYILLLENEKINNNNYNYLMHIDELCALLHEQKIKNVGICLDIGHLLFGAHKESIIQECCLVQLKKMSWILSMTKQIHIHDYLGTDHLPLGEGIMDLDSVLKFVVAAGLFVPVIIETTVKKSEYDGLRQVLLIGRKLKDIKEKIK